MSDSQRQRLESWKEIAAYLRRTVRTVQRWETEQGLPVHRLAHNRLPTVYAFADEIDRWWESRKTSIEQMEPVEIDLTDANEIPAEPSPVPTPAKTKTPRSEWILAVGALTIVAVVVGFAIAVRGQNT